MNLAELPANQVTAELQARLSALQGPDDFPFTLASVEAKTVIDRAPVPVPLRVCQAP